MARPRLTLLPWMTCTLMVRLVNFYAYSIGLPCSALGITDEDDLIALKGTKKRKGKKIDDPDFMVGFQKEN